MDVDSAHYDLGRISVDECTVEASRVIRHRSRSRAREGWVTGYLAQVRLCFSCRTYVMFHLVCREINGFYRSRRETVALECATVTFERGRLPRGVTFLLARNQEWI